MATALKNARNKPSAATQTEILTVPSDKTAVISNITVCNQSATPTSFRIALRPLGAVLALADYLYYDIEIEGNDTFQQVSGQVCMGGDILETYATLATLSFNISYQENS